ncbi:MAG: right-handed parallel beta-helix repeat-containing protein, partial [Ignavibacteria bacterium]|nr:right-handed parallel beta-helix repeat-containing protein [Ignavibacteria bacterium]
VNGRFDAFGSATDSIIFTSPTPDSLGFYEGFRFNANSSSNLSIIGFTKISYAKYAFRCIDVSPILSDCHIYKCGRGVQLSNSNALILDNRIERSYEYGITMTLGSSPTIIGNHLIRNNTQGTSAKNQISIGLQGNNSPDIQNNIIEGGESIPTGGISLWVSGSTAFSNTIIAGNEIFNNSFGITLYSTSNGIVNAIVKNNRIYNNKINPNAQVSGSGINVNGSPTNQPIITKNEIFGNWWGVTIQNGTTVQAGPNPNLGNIENTDTTDDGVNNIYNNVQGTDTFDVYNNCTNDIYAQNNDWNVYDSTAIENHIFHKVDDATHGLVKFAPFFILIPVELTAFTAKVVDGNVILNWITATELNNSGFEVLRLKDSKIEKLKNLPTGQAGWESIGFISGNGTSTETHNYSFPDKNPYDGKSYYRLKQIDFDGSFEYTEIVEIDFSLPIEFSLEQNYPNPFNPSTKIIWQSPVGSHQTLKVYDVLGNEIATLVDEYRDAGSYEVDFTAGYVSGVYFYRLQAGSYIETKKMILLR